MLSYQLMELVPLYINEDPLTADSKEGIRVAESAADDVYFPVPCKCELLMAGGLVTKDCGGETTEGELEFHIRVKAGTNTDKVDKGAGNVKLGETEAGNVVYDRAKQGTILYPGQELVCAHVQATGTGADGQVRPFVMVRPVSEEPVNLDNMIETE